MARSTWPHENTVETLSPAGDVSKRNTRAAQVIPYHRDFLCQLKWLQQKRSCERAQQPNPIIISRASEI
jgi:hypothetical protein